MQTEGDKRPTTGTPAGDLKDSTSRGPTGNHPTHHWKREIIGTLVPSDRSTVFFGALPMARTNRHRPDNPIVLTVRDERTGRSKDVRRSTTEPFSTAEGAACGTGPGLAIVHGFVQQSLGRLKMDSMGGGTEIRMLFPIAHAVPGAVPPPAARARGEARRGSAGGSETILVAEDSDDVRALAHRMRAALGSQSADLRRNANLINAAEG